jgi:hypothetical protein
MISRAALCLLASSFALGAHANPADPPLQARLAERTAEVEKLRLESDKLRQDVSRLESELVTARAAPRPAEATQTPVRETVFLRSPERPGSTSWTFVLGVAAVMLLVGFVIGWKTLDRRIRQKYGGLRIY